MKTSLSDFDESTIKTDSIESVVAEKFDAMLQRFVMINRTKGFYDISYMEDYYNLYYLARNFNFEGRKL